MSTARLRPLWYAPIFNSLYWFPLLLVPAGIARLSAPPPGQWPTTPWAMIAGAFLPVALHMHAARASGTFLELSRTGVLRSVWGRARLLRWAEIERFRVRSNPRGPSWVVAELRAAPFALVDDPLGRTVSYVPGHPQTVRIDGKWTVFLFGGLTSHSLRDALEAWRAWAVSDIGLTSSLPPVPIPSPGELVELWSLVEIVLGSLVCLFTGIAGATIGGGGPLSVLGSLMCFALLSLLVAVPVVIAFGAARIRARALVWQMGWIVFALATSWAGHLAATALRGLRTVGR